MAGKSTKHIYPNADVRILVDDAYFDVHRFLLSRKSEYFRTLFNGPWSPPFPSCPSPPTFDFNTTDGTASDSQTNPLPTVTPGLTTAEEFILFLDFAYAFMTTPFQVKIGNLLRAETVAVKLQVEELDSLCRSTSFNKHGNRITWKNVEEFLKAATDHEPRLEAVRRHCELFLHSTDPKQKWTRALYLGEKYALELIVKNAAERVPCDPGPFWNDPYFQQLSATLRAEVAISRLKKTGFEDLFCVC
ncbi:hypothetical protein HKX48_001857, partial [Thoreauomyces humboldtii]